MATIKGKDVERETDYAGYPIDSDADYVVDHIDGNGNAEYARFNPCTRGDDQDQDFGDFAYLFN